MAEFEFGWLGLLLVMTSGGFGAIAIIPFVSNVAGGGAAFVLYVILSAIAAIIAAGVAERYPA